MPSSRSGAHTWTNLVAACKRCNAKKGDYTPEEAQMFLKRKPYKPSYALFLRDGNIQQTEWDEYLD
ncbi:MAG: HNH endonuclease, partial [Cyclobacteriaceae bacterium]|nr:HNH endonuclease [Cyclobacteriaceae bacterium]